MDAFHKPRGWLVTYDNGYDEVLAEMVWATSKIGARHLGLEAFGIDECDVGEDHFEVERRPELDEFSKTGVVPAKVMRAVGIREEGSRECDTCGLGQLYDCKTKEYIGEVCEDCGQCDDCGCDCCTACKDEDPEGCSACGGSGLRSDQKRRESFLSAEQEWADFNTSFGEVSLIDALKQIRGEVEAVKRNVIVNRVILSEEGLKEALQNEDVVSVFVNGLLRHTREDVGTIDWEKDQVIVHVREVLHDYEPHELREKRNWYGDGGWPAGDFNHVYAGIKAPTRKAYYIDVGNLDVERMIKMSDEEYYEGTIYVPDQPTMNGRVYPKDVLAKAVKEFAESGARYVQAAEGGVPGSGSLKDVAATIDWVQEDEQGRVTIGGKVLDTPGGKLIQEMAKSAHAGGPYRARRLPFAIAPNGIGTVDEDGAVKEIKISSFDFVRADQVNHDSCLGCGGSGDILHMYERPGGPPGNQLVPCETCGGKGVVADDGT
jgi:hypothetical protein